MINRYAKINSDNIVETMILCEDLEISQISGNFVLITENTNEPVHGYPYNPVLQKFQQGPQPYPSWNLNETTLIWEAPIAKPEGFHRWDEDSQEWISLS